MISSNRKGGGRYRRRAAVVLMATALAVLPACGSRQSHAALQAAFLGGGQAGRVNTGGSAGAGGGGDSAGPSVSGGAPAASGGGGASTSIPTAGGALNPPGVTKNGNGGGSGTSPGGGISPSGGTSPGGGTGGGPNASAAATCTGKEQPIVLGTVGEQSGVVGSVIKAGPQMVAAWAAWINQRGGLACHQVKYIIADDGGDPSRNAALTQQLVEQDHVVALVQTDGSLAYKGGMPYLIEHNIPVIGSESAAQDFYEHPNYFPQVSSGNAGNYANMFALAAALTSDERSHLGILVCNEAAQCTSVGQNGPPAARAAGMTVVYQGTASLSQPDYSAVCIQARSAGVKALFLEFDSNSVHRIAKSCAGVSFHPHYATLETAVLPDIATDPNLDGLVLGAVARPGTDNSNPNIAQMNEVIQQYAPGLSNVGQTRLGWTSAKLLEYASKFFPSNPTVTSADILAAMDQVKNYDVGGLTGPLTFTAGKNAPEVVCWWTIEVQGGKFVTPVGTTRKCR